MGVRFAVFSSTHLHARKLQYVGHFRQQLQANCKLFTLPIRWNVLDTQQGVVLFA
ncbi:hypothetical protein HOV93_49830 [Planctomycetes bacterium FF15]|uniref:Uncharacterized protein n=1 Tax=Bremerella alba TaxID=980252 RepID=A0A7V8VAB7_9BACT|nr:hypothetical protein [Bremerella alba]